MSSHIVQGYADYCSCRLYIQHKMSDTEDCPPGITAHLPPLDETPPPHTATPSLPPTHAGAPIPPWSDTAREYMVLERFPHLRRRLEGTLDSLQPQASPAHEANTCARESHQNSTLQRSLVPLQIAMSLVVQTITSNPTPLSLSPSFSLSLQEREELRQLVEQRRVEVGVGGDCHAPLHGKVSLLAGGNLVHVGVDAVVNASNHWLTSGKGVNGALHSAAGQCLLEECLSLGGCAVGEAKMTSGYNLPASHVTHTVGPEGKDQDRAQSLRWVGLVVSSGWGCSTQGLSQHYPQCELEQKLSPSLLQVVL